MVPKKNINDRIQELETGFVVLSTDMKWVKKLGFGFFALLAANLVLNIVANIESLKDIIF